MTSHQIKDPVRALEFALAGNAKLTIVSKKTGVRFTYSIAKPFNKVLNKRDFDAKLSFVSVLRGPQNESDYSYMGVIASDNNEFKRSKGSKVGEAAASFKAFQFFWGHLVKGKVHEGLEVYHEGKCGRCGRTLTVPASIESGIGPECAKHFGIYRQPVLPFSAPKPGERGFQSGCGCCTGPEDDRCVCHFHQDMRRGLYAHKCSLHQDTDGTEDYNDLARREAAHKNEFARREAEQEQRAFERKMDDEEAGLRGRGL